MKRLTLLRHGQSQHNAMYDVDHHDPCVFDAPLTELGERQAMDVFPECQLIYPELVIVSPLTRAIQTCLLAFPPGKHTSSRYEVWREAAEHLEAGCDIGSSPTTLQQRFPRLDFSDLPTVWWYIPEGCDSTDPSAGRLAFQEQGYFEPIQTDRRAENYSRISVARCQPLRNTDWSPKPRQLMDTSTHSAVKVKVVNSHIL
jgi:broad specificity phosphatase PhoE